jgi:hypothetical protein
MISPSQLIAVAAEILPGAEFNKFLLVNHQLPISDWQRVIEFAWYAGLDPSENIAAMRKQFPQAPEAIFNLKSLDAMQDGDPDDPDTAIVIHHESDQCAAVVVELVDRIRCHPGPIVAFLDAAATLQSDGELTPISPLYGSIGCEIHYLSDDPAGPIVAIRRAVTDLDAAQNFEDDLSRVKAALAKLPSLLSVA